MPSLSQLSRLVENYRNGSSLPLDDFVESFERISRVMFSGGQDLVEACLRVEDSLSRYRDREVDESELKAELGNAIRPFVSCSDSAGVVVYEIPRRLLAATAAAVLVLSVAPANGLLSPHLKGAAISNEPVVVGNPSKETESTTQPFLSSQAVA